MGRKIPGKRHRGIKDPLKQQEQRFEKIKMLVNAAPSNPDVQEIPKSVQEINRLRELAKSSFNKKCKDKRCSHFSRDGKKSMKEVKNERRLPLVKQRAGESDKSFISRIDGASNDMLNEVRMELKYNFSPNDSNTPNAVDLLARNPYIVHKKSTLVPNNRKLKKSKMVDFKGERLRKQKERLKLRKLKKHLKKSKGLDENESLKVDKVAFGEVVHRPPLLTTRPKGSDISTSERPGSKNLLLKKYLSDNSQRSISHLKQISAERERVIKAYREMKKRNRNNSK